jgi:16S rRNA (guanine527-N7)-methyltransferase
MIDIIEKYFPELSDRQKEQLTYMQELYEEWNAQINVISRKDMEHFTERHLLHSLSIALYMKFKAGWWVADIGTGGGFPGIPLAILYPDVKFNLIDSIGKKIKVVKAVSEALELKNVTAIWGRAEEQDIQVNVIVTRAVAPLPDLVKWATPLLKAQSKGIIALKGGDLTDELQGYKKRSSIIPLSNYFEEPFFESKSLVHYQP